MQPLLGLLIKRNRLAQNLSQESLCKGICVVSYLSKIETGQVVPSPEIIDQLFRALGLAFERDEAFLSAYRSLLKDFFDRFFHQEPAEAIQEELVQAGARLENSELCLAYQLFLLYRCLLRKEPDKALSLFQSLAPLRQLMGPEDAFLYEMAHSATASSFEEKREALYRAQGLRMSPAVSLALAQLHYEAGRYQEALLYCAQGYQLSAQEGNVYAMRELSFLEGTCYANLFEHQLMLDSYLRCRELARGDAELVLHIEYNIGASFLEMGRHEEALSYLLRVWEAWGDSPESFLLLHKLAIAYEQLGRKETGRPYLDKALDIARHGSDPVSQAMIRVVQLRYDSDHRQGEEYLLLLEDLIRQLESQRPHGFRQFHLPFLLEAYTDRRRYKEALTLAREMPPQLRFHFPKR
ncbi:MAG: helix-turn-helix transcriptional regulator [Candidatus Limiplasma sp.]|nr:helix-turn-helix transcriptional regulator [Candidatus Limiplasma sp.]